MDTKVLLRKRNVIWTAVDCMLFIRIFDQAKGKSSHCAQGVTALLGPAVTQMEWQSELGEESKNILPGSPGQKAGLLHPLYKHNSCAFQAHFKTMESLKSNSKQSEKRRYWQLWEPEMVISRQVLIFLVTCFHLFCTMPCILHILLEKKMHWLWGHTSINQFLLDKTQTNECCRMGGADAQKGSWPSPTPSSTNSVTFTLSPKPVEPCFQF